MNKSINIVVVGVGGQGLLTLTRILCSGALAKGYEALAAETHGMSQRGGSVIVHVRIGTGILAPLIPEGGADYMLGLELLESIRYLRYCNRHTVALINDKLILPPLATLKYTANDLKSYISSRVGRAIFIHASDIALNLGVPQSANMVMLGAIAKLLNEYLDIETMRKLVGMVGRGKIAEANLRAFDIGYQELDKYIE